MSLLSDFMTSGGKPKLITRYTSGTGTFVPSVDMARCFVRIQAGGASGGSSTDNIGGAGGGGGAMVEVLFRVPIAGVAYVVGAGGGAVTGSVSGVNGGLSRFNTITANGGLGGNYRALTQSGLYSCGGSLGNLAGTVNASGAGMSVMGSVTGVSGGSGGGGYSAGYKGSAPGFPVNYDNANGWIAALNGISTSFGLGGGGGDSFFGIGGNGASVTVGSAGTGYGSGGGGSANNYASGAGAGGLIEIWDFGV